MMIWYNETLSTCRRRSMQQMGRQLLCHASCEDVPNTETASAKLLSALRTSLTACCRL